MHTPNTLKHAEGQLSLDFSRASIERSVAEPVKNRLHAITSERTEFHAEASEIGPYTFAIKLTYMGRSFLIKGGYRLERIRSFSDPTFSNTVVRGVRLDAISAFRNGRYIPEFLPRREQDAIEKQVLEIISSPFYNTHLSEGELAH